MSPFIDYFQHLSLREGCAHDFNEPNISTVETMIAMFCMSFLLGVKYTSNLTFMVAPYCQYLRLEFSVRVAIQFFDQGKFSLCHLILNRQYIKNLRRIISYGIISSFTYVIAKSSILLILRCRKTPSFSISEACRVNLFHPHSRGFMGVARNIKNLLRRLTDFQKWFNDTIDKEEEAIILSTLQLS